MREAAGSAGGVDPGAAINAEVDWRGDAAVHRAAERGDAGEVRHILAIPGVDVNLQGYKGSTALEMASGRGYSEVVLLLLAAPGIDVNRGDGHGVTPLSEDTIPRQSEPAPLTPTHQPHAQTCTHLIDDMLRPR